jgi:hypothetical protein
MNAYPALAGAAFVGAALLVAAFAGSPDVPDSTNADSPQSAKQQKKYDHGGCQAAQSDVCFRLLLVHRGRVRSVKRREVG